MNLELVTNLLQRNVPDFVNDQVKFWIDMAQEAIRRDEREKLLAYGELIADRGRVDYMELLIGVTKGEHLK
jgi:hypothetical protein